MPKTSKICTFAQWSLRWSVAQLREKLLVNIKFFCIFFQELIVHTGFVYSKKGLGWGGDCDGFWRGERETRLTSGVTAIHDRVIGQNIFNEWTITKPPPRPSLSSKWPTTYLYIQLPRDRPLRLQTHFFSHQSAHREFFFEIQKLWRGWTGNRRRMEGNILMNLSSFTHRPRGWSWFLCFGWWITNGQNLYLNKYHFIVENQ